MSNTIKLMVVGRIKEPWIRDAVAEFEKRLTRFAKFSVLELKDSNPEKEGIEISSRIKGTTYLLDETGVEYTSEGFAQLIRKNEDKEMTFVIGSASGFSADLKKSYPK